MKHNMKCTQQLPNTAAKLFKYGKNQPEQPPPPENIFFLNQGGAVLDDNFQWLS